MDAESVTITSALRSALLPSAQVIPFSLYCSINVSLTLIIF